MAIGLLALANIQFISVIPLKNVCHNKNAEKIYPNRLKPTDIIDIRRVERDACPEIVVIGFVRQNSCQDFAQIIHLKLYSE